MGLPARAKLAPTSVYVAAKWPLASAERINGDELGQVMKAQNATMKARDYPVDRSRHQSAAISADLRDR
ncbi:hypothetical protein [Phytoactinopolyspora limicola]|uniref:hypothetical protein n=1 Tax=Phytoactinopolyspora limicola TaxID=2715536 RepID=UPI00140B2CD3|nr:hypothetical protein [Phytoactinopolyspora limicola]